MGLSASAPGKAVDARSEPMVPPLRAKTLPAIAKHRCVHHGGTVRASCRACADACPRGAWIVDGDGVCLDEQACDGCGLCAPVCPQGVIAHAHKVARRMEGGRRVAFAACSQTGLRNGRDGVEGVMPCLNALGLADLAELYGAGVRRMVITRKSCATCPTGGATTVRLERAVAELNVLLEGRGLPPLVLTRRSPTPWRAYLTFDSTPDEAAPAREFSSPPPPSPGRLLPEPCSGGPAGTAPWPWVPSIDSGACEGCARCARLCPTGAIALEADPPAFRMTAEDCTGCHLCVDVCRPGALILERLAPRRQTSVALRPWRCPACGTVSRLPAERPGADGLCPACRRTARTRT